MLYELFHRVTPVRSSLKSVDGLGAMDTRKRPDLNLKFLGPDSYTTCSACCNTCVPLTLKVDVQPNIDLSCAFPASGLARCQASHLL
jgi:hypothetical protein